MNPNTTVVLSTNYLNLNETGHFDCKLDITNEQLNNKTNKMTCAPSEDMDGSAGASLQPDQNLALSHKAIHRTLSGG